MSNKGNETTILAFDLVVKVPVWGAGDSCNTSDGLVQHPKSSWVTIKFVWPVERISKPSNNLQKKKKKSHQAKITTTQAAHALPFFNSFASCVSFRGSSKQMLECLLSVHRRAWRRGGEVGSPAAVVLDARPRCRAVAIGAVFPSGRVRSLQGGLGHVRLFFWAAFDVAAHVFAHLKRKWKMRRSFENRLHASTAPAS